MRRKITYAIVAIMLMVSLQAMSEDHIKFKGIPLGISLTEFKQKLSSMGYKFYASYQCLDTYKGKYAGRDDCSIMLLYTPKTKKVHSVFVAFPIRDDWSELCSEYDALKKALDVKYNEVVSKKEFIFPYEDSDASLAMTAVRNGKCDYNSFYLHLDGSILIKIENLCYVSIIYQSSPMYDLYKSESSSIIEDDL